MVAVLIASERGRKECRLYLETAARVRCRRCESDGVKEMQDAFHSMSRPSSRVSSPPQYRSSQSRRGICTKVRLMSERDARPLSCTTLGRMDGGLIQLPRTF